MECLHESYNLHFLVDPLKCSCNKQKHHKFIRNYHVLKWIYTPFSGEQHEIDSQKVLSCCPEEVSRKRTKKAWFPWDIWYMGWIMMDGNGKWMMMVMDGWWWMMDGSMHDDFRVPWTPLSYSTCHCQLHDIYEMVSTNGCVLDGSVWRNRVCIMLSL